MKVDAGTAGSFGWHVANGVYSEVGFFIVPDNQLRLIILAFFGILRLQTLLRLQLMQELILPIRK